MFRHYSAEAYKHLGIPDSPVIHLAITTLAGRLLPLAAGSKEDPEALRIAALRMASGGALRQLPFECVALEYLEYFDLATQADRDASTEAYRTTRTDWLRQAREQILSEGGDPGPDAQRMATDYGWNPSPRAPETTRGPSLPMLMVDERGRSWQVPTDRDALFDLVNEFGRRHGRPSGAVHAAFARHGRMADLRLLVVRGAEGEKINLAARALALGALPVLERTMSPFMASKSNPEEAMRKLREADARRDAIVMRDLHAEAEALRTQGYAD